ncbi:MAG: potassium transporter TrkA [Epsilonproteobacteria bacterium]|nr:potassium transporter TrkA [Campylobacterota bacterium]
MQRVLILADGIVAKYFLRRLVKTFISKNEYHIVYTDEEILPKESKENLHFYHFDPTSFIKLSKLFSKKYKEVIIVLATKIDTYASFKNVRELDKNVTVIVLDRWNLELEGKNFIRLDANEILASRVEDHLPNVPVVARNVGLGIGDVMEVLVPIGSSYVYRHVGSIEQRDWRIAAIYRDNRIVLPSSDTMILPNDILLLVGKPQILLEIFKSIKREVGQFPMPFGRDSYLFIDMEKNRPKRIKELMLGAIYLHSKLKDKKLIVRVANPTDIKTLEFLRSYDSKTVEVIIDYFYRPSLDLLQNDFKVHKIGLFLVPQELFFKKEYRKLLYLFAKPVISLSSYPFEKVKEVYLPLTGNPSVENISSILFDIAIQLKLKLKLYEDFQSNSPIDMRLIEHFENLANIFSKPIEIKKAKTNLIRTLRKEPPSLLVYPFSKKVVKANPFNLFCTDPESLFYKLSMHHQLFIPI